MKSLLLIALQLAASGSDAYFTHRNQANGRRPYENNPIAAPFVKTTHGQVLFFGGNAALRIYGAHLLRQHQHQRLADALAIESIADNASAAGFSATHP